MTDYGEQMHLMGQIEALLKAEIRIMAERQKLEAKLNELKEKNPPQTN